MSGPLGWTMSEDNDSATLVLIRHCQARAADGSYGPETPLSELGRRQASALASLFVGGTLPSAVYTSPYTRAVQTSEPLSERLGLNPVVDRRLAEFELGTAALDSVTYDQERPDLAIWHPEHTGVEGGETLREFCTRVAGFLGEVVERHVGEWVALVSHAGTIDAALRWSLGIGPKDLCQYEFDIPNGSIAEVEFWPRGRGKGGAPRYATLRRIGDVAHLRGLVSRPPAPWVIGGGHPHTPARGCAPWNLVPSQADHRLSFLAIAEKPFW